MRARVCQCKRKDRARPRMGKSVSAGCCEPVGYAPLPRGSGASCGQDSNAPHPRCQPEATSPQTGAASNSSEHGGSPTPGSPASSGRRPAATADWSRHQGPARLPPAPACAAALRPAAVFAQSVPPPAPGPTKAALGDHGPPTGTVGEDTSPGLGATLHGSPEQRRDVLGRPEIPAGRGFDHRYKRGLSGVWRGPGVLAVRAVSTASGLVVTSRDREAQLNST